MSAEKSVRKFTDYSVWGNGCAKNVISQESYQQFVSNYFIDTSKNGIIMSEQRRNPL